MGKISINPKLSPGTYIASIVFYGNENYTNAAASSNKFTINAKPQPITPQPSPSNPIVNPTKTLYKVKMYLTIKKIKVSKNVKKLYLKFTVKFNDKKLTTRNIILKVKHNKIKTKKLTKMQNFKFTVKIKGKIYTPKTNKKGKITYTITNIYKNGTYTAKISYQDKKHYKSSAKIKFKIKQ